MKVYELFFECLKLILKGKGKYNCYLVNIPQSYGRINGTLTITKEDDDLKRILFW